jgi:hypothetical protein
MRQSHGSINASTGSFDPDTLTMLYQAFDETWRQIGGNYPDEPKQLNGNQADPKKRSNARIARQLIDRAPFAPKPAGQSLKRRRKAHCNDAVNYVGRHCGNVLLRTSDWADI